MVNAEIVGTKELSDCVRSEISSHHNVSSVIDRVIMLMDLGFTYIVISTDGRPTADLIEEIKRFGSDREH